MLNRPFREYHILAILDAYEVQTLPLDLFLRNYFRAHKALGSKDRGEIAETVYTLTRWRGLLDFLVSPVMTWDARLDRFLSWDLEKLMSRDDIPMHVRLSFPKVLFDLFEHSHGYDMACELCRISNTAAPTTVRINTMKTTRDVMLEKWQGLYPVEACSSSAEGIVFAKRINFFAMLEFKEGLFEIQDEGSQLLAALVQAQPGQAVMDYCAGAGGKSLAFAPRMENKGQIYLHDIRKHVLQDCRKRLRRAGIQNAQVAYEDDAKLKKLKKKMDWVLVDAPCTGTGTLRRNPDMKWKFDAAMLERLVGQQRTIFEKALSYMKPDGRIVYATCSVFKEENELQLDHFIKTYGLELAADVFQSLPVKNGMDGFYGAVLKKREAAKGKPSE